MTELGHPPFDHEELAMLRSVTHKLKGLIETYLESPAVNRQAIYRFCEIVEMLREMAAGDRTRLRSYLDQR